jgi:TolB-like protein/Tfp pilus assembly protein PilF
MGEPTPVTATRETVALDRSIVSIDVVEFCEMAKAGELEHASELYRGELLEGLSFADAEFEDWLLVERTRVHDLAVDVLQRLLVSQNGEPAVRTAQRLLQLDPTREETHCALMQLYAQAGSRSQALRQYQICRDRLKHDLDVAPSAETEALYRLLMNSSGFRSPDGGQSSRSSILRESAEAMETTAPVIAVLPFTNLSGDPEQQYFSDGVTEDIITELSRFRDLFVIARHSCFQYRDKAMDLRKLGRELGARFLLEGSFRRSGSRVRISAQLIDAESGNHVWAERYDRDMADVLILQEELAQTIAATISGRIDAAARDRAIRLSPAGLKAYDLVLRGEALQLKFNKTDMEQARSLARRAIEIDPMNARAHVLYSACCLDISVAHWTAERDRLFEEAVQHARRAVALDDADSVTQHMLGFLDIFRREYEEARIHCERALECNPNDTDARTFYAMFFIATGQPEAAIEQLDLVKRHNPFDLYWVPWVKGIAFFSARRYDEAIAVLKQIPEPINEIRGWLAASYAQGGRLVEAKAGLDEFLRVAKHDMVVYPGDRLKDWEPYWHAVLPYRDQRDFDHLFEGLRKAGMPE